MGFAGISEAHYLYQVLNHVNLSNYFAIKVSFPISLRSHSSISWDKNGSGGIFSYHANKFVYLGKK